MNTTGSVNTANTANTSNSANTANTLNSVNTANTLNSANIAKNMDTANTADMVNSADTGRRKKAADIICLIFDLLVFALVCWQLVPAVGSYTAAGLAAQGAVAGVEREAEAGAAEDEDSIFNEITVESEQQAAILEVLRKKWPESRAPWENGYEGRCETWVCEVYQAAGIPVSGSCCASRSREEFAVWSEDIPVGAMVYSGTEYLSGFLCEDCGLDPGHVGIYIGDGRIAGSQEEYILTLDEWKEYFGYGGWSFGGSFY